MERGEACLEQTVEQLYDNGLNSGQIAEAMGVDVGWVEDLVSMWGYETGGSDNGSRDA